MRVPILETDEALTGAPPLRLFEPGQSLAKYDRQRTLIRARRAREDTGRPFFGREGSRAMFSTYQGGPFVEVFTPQVSARPAARHRISSEPALRMSEGEKYPRWRAQRAKGGNPRAPWIAHPRPDSPAPGRLDDLATRAGATRGGFFSAAIPPAPPAPRPDPRSTLPFR